MNVAKVDYKGRTNSQEEKTEKKAEGKGKRMQSHKTKADVEGTKKTQGRQGKNA